ELVMAVGLETAGGSWKLALQDGRRGKPALHTCKEQQAQARLEAAVQRIEQTKGKWGLPTGTRVVIVYEAGQEGFWIARALRALRPDREVAAHGGLLAESSGRLWRRAPGAAALLRCDAVAAAPAPAAGARMRAPGVAARAAQRAGAVTVRGVARAAAGAGAAAAGAESGGLGGCLALGL